MQASLYIRLSRRAGESNVSLKGMIAEGTAKLEAEGYDVVSVHVDEGKSGAIRDRPEFLAWLAEDVDCLGTYHADRLTREGINAAAMVLDRVEGKDSTTGQVVRPPVRLLSADGLDSRDEDAFRWRFVIAAEVGRSELRRITERNLNTQRRLREAGRHRGGPAPYGTEIVVRDGGKYLQVNEAEAAVLREAASRLLRGDSMRGTLRWLNTEGHRTRSGKQWARTSLVGSLRSGSSREHVFDLATVRAIEERLTRNGPPVRRGGRPSTWLLSGGMAQCGGCGGTMVTTSYMRRGESVMRYHCAAASYGRLCPSVVTIYAEPVDAEIERQFLEHYGATHALEIRITLTGAADLDAAERADEEARKALDADLTAENLAKAQEARARLEAAKSEPIQRVREIWPSEKTYGQMWSEADLPERNQMVAEALARPVVIKPRPKDRTGLPTRGIDLARLDIVWRDEINP